ncbi:hypothetical protein RDI58_024304 [Solanum bulbocastanum]|uniref:hAT-like transposase RNase-H fold domain-containing protein n=1 Tax=Solanum bulbocastanum TaxID=147425 RepID=A0AAN8T2X8_SOLBU
MTIRWNFTYLMLESAILYQQAYIQYKSIDTSYKHGLSEEEWKRVEMIAQFFKPFYNITTLFSRSQYPTINLYLHNVWKIQKLLEGKKGSIDPVMNEMATSMLKKFKKYWKSYSMILSPAIVLDPRYKLKFVKFTFSKIDREIVEAKVKVVEDHLQLLFKEYYVSSTTISLSGETSNEMRDELEAFDTFDNHLGVL